MKKYSLHLIATALFALSQSPLYGMDDENSFFNTEEKSLEIPEPTDFFASLTTPNNSNLDSNSSLGQTIDLEKNKDLIPPSFGLDDSENINNTVPAPTEEELDINNLFSNFLTNTTDTVPVQNLPTPQITNQNLMGLQTASPSKKHPRENSNKRLKNQSEQKKTRLNNPITISTNFGSNSSQSITTESASSSSSTTNTWVEYLPAHWDKKTWNNYNLSQKVQTIATLLEDAGTSTEMLDKIKLKLDQLIQIPRSSLDYFLNPPKKSNDSIIQQAINKNNTMGHLHLKFILNLLNNKINSLKQCYNRTKNYQLLTKKLEQCILTNTTTECSELVINVKNAINNTLKENLILETKASKIFKKLGKLLNGPTQQSNSLNTSSSSQNQLLPTLTPSTQPQTITTIPHPQETQQIQQNPTKNQPLSTSQPLQKKQNTSQQSVANATTTSSCSSQSIAIGSSSSTSSTKNTWTGYPPSHWDQKNWNAPMMIKGFKQQIIADLLEDAGTSPEMLDEINLRLYPLTQQPRSSLDWFFNPTGKSKDSVIQLAINKNNTTGHLHLKFILNLLNNKILSSECYYSHINNYQLLANKLEQCILTNTTPECSELVTNVKKAINNALKENLSTKNKASTIIKELKQLLNGPTQLSNSLNTSQSQTNITILRPIAIRPSTPPSNNQQNQPQSQTPNQK
ncbi:TPA: hypothetical protein DDZ86_00100 [Candidatus Dependentiae bacterium]|nr:MAG: hypothetical protein UW09_C0002G0099 [candidate division TM6 bacterium GW2011_GWF2_43_87]HBL98029.1 hypothetical protein [Candidatus Dependentiae bacterium]